MTSNYFEKLRTKAWRVDEGIDKLSKTWEMPQVLSIVNCTGEPTEDLDSYVEGVRDVVKNTKNELEKLGSEVESEDSVAQILEEVRQEYENFREECNNLYSVFAEYGYHYGSDQANGNADKSSDQTLIEETENLRLESTPRSNSELEEEGKFTPFTPASNGSYKPGMISLNNSTESAEGSFIACQDHMYTPGGSRRPPEPIYSKHFYNLLKK